MNTLHSLDCCREFPETAPAVFLEGDGKAVESNCANQIADLMYLPGDGFGNLLLTMSRSFSHQDSFLARASFVPNRPVLTV
ncbi:MAG TPA: hypothetical protein VNR18_12195 [Hyphomicrobiales bacterium]|nr:hypothetical protein [Hyphomicrobiales bacterium]